MNYLLTGGTGLIGQSLINKLQATRPNATITVLTRNKDNAEQKLGAKINFVTELTLGQIEQADVIINLAGEPIADKRWSPKQKQTICESRWNITQQLVELINQAKKPPSLFLSGSAIGLYGDQKQKVVDEKSQKFTQEFTHQLCQKWENIAQNVKHANTRVLLLRTGVVLAKNAGALKKMLPPFKLGLGGKIGTGEQYMSWIHIDDVINAILYLQTNDNISGPVNLTAPGAVTNKTFSTELAGQLKRPCVFTTPGFILRLLLGEMADILLTGQHVKPHKLINSGFKFQHKTLKTALKNILAS